ncbi:MAG: hypothetical protein JST86_01580 [Bacteroidetes bacterium]|nr:hypothetical protein [Bacteroidota bacterium]
MKQTLLLMAGLLIALLSYSQTEIKLEEVSKHVGDSVKVCGKIYGGIFLERSSGTPTFLNVGGAYPNNPLTIVIWADVRKQFEQKPEEFYKDKAVCVYGKIELYKDKPQIVLHQVKQLVLNTGIAQ